MTSLRIPRATCRLQLHGGFTLEDAAGLVDYLDRLGVSDLYLSPIFTAPPGAAHGYHVIDPTTVDPELGGAEALLRLAAALRRHDMGLLLDIVPNHLAADPENPWWADVLARGRASEHAARFDIDWEAGEGRVVLPVLGASVDEEIAAGNLTVGVDGDVPHVRYHDVRFPVAPGTADEARAIARRRPPGDGGGAKRGSGGAGTATAEAAAKFRALLERQHYRLVHWRAGLGDLNYRRFFDITDLVGVRVEDPEVFAARHERLLELVASGVVTGLRVDHVDGLRDPTGYLRALASAAAGAAGTSSFYVVVEKILEGEESLPEEWPVAGTTGYELLNGISALFVDRAGYERIRAAYREFTGLDRTAPDLAHARKLDALRRLFPVEVEGIVRRLCRLADRPAVRTGGRPPSEQAIRQTLVALTASFPVYRTYIRAGDVTDRDRARLEEAFEEARRRHPRLDPDALGLLRRLLMLELPDGLDPELREEWIDLVQRWQQLTGPAMAKGFEDTTFYVLNRLISLNEVGADARGLEEPRGVESFHAAVAARARGWPHTLNATSTHDTKRSQDVRARLQVLTEAAGGWASAAARWSGWNEQARGRVREHDAPDRNEEWLLYQTLVGIWPPGGAAPGEEPGLLRERVLRFMEKAVREAKVHSSWMDPDPEHEEAVANFVRTVFRNERFLADLTSFVDRIALAGAVNSLSQVVLKIAAPGVPDIYQGNELWDRSLVDPDNRRPVDYARRRRLLEEVRDAWEADPEAVVRQARDSWRDGRLKLLVTWRALEARRRRPRLFREGTYEPLEVEGPHSGRIVAFARRLDGEWAAAIAPRLTLGLGGPGDWPVGERWGATRVRLPDAGGTGARRVRARETLTDRPVKFEEGWMRVADTFLRLPGALLIPYRSRPEAEPPERSRFPGTSPGSPAYTAGSHPRPDRPDSTMNEQSRQIRRRRTFAIISHPDAGKTTLTEKLLLYGGALHLAGSVKARRAARHATSDWIEMEKERGISVTSSVLQFEYDGYKINLLDTPGHADFSEDTYRTLIAADSAVMLLDNRKGVEERTRKLFRVCERRRTPIFTVVNKCDRFGTAPLQLLDDVESEFGIRCWVATWPILAADGRLRGVFDRTEGRVHLFRRSEDHGQKRADVDILGRDDPRLADELGPETRESLMEELELLELAGEDFDRDDFLAGHLSPTYFASALTNFGVEPFLRHFLRLAPPPGPRESSEGPVDPEAEGFTGFVFKIQANMDPRHRDRIAFIRICSGAFEPGMRVTNVRSGEEIRLASPQQFLAQEREAVTDAWPGDVVGVHDRGNLRIGDTVSRNGTLTFGGIPRFSPEHFARIRVPDPLRRKHLDKGLQQLSEEGAAQVFYAGSTAGPAPIVGAVGMLQFDVLLHRLEHEYGVEARLEHLPYTVARWVEGDEDAIRRIASGYGRTRVFDSERRPLILFENEFTLRRTREEVEERGLEFHAVAP